MKLLTQEVMNRELLLMLNFSWKLVDKCNVFQYFNTWMTVWGKLFIFLFPSQDGPRKMLMLLSWLTGAKHDSSSGCSDVPCNKAPTLWGFVLSLFNLFQEGLFSRNWNIRSKKIPHSEWITAHLVHGQEATSGRFCEVSSIVLVSVHWNAFWP